MWWIIVRAEIGLFLLSIVLHSCSSASRIRERPVALSKDTVTEIDRLIHAKRYREAMERINRVEDKITDANQQMAIAYRRAYLHVIAEEGNPFYDYRKAVQAFETFQRQFPHSPYVSACNNWLKILYYVSQLQSQKDQLQKQVNVLQAEMKQLHAQKLQLENTLRDLERVMQRNR